MRILTEPRNAVARQFTKFLSLDKVELVFTPGALEAAAELALGRRTGARALRSIVEEALLDVMYEIPERTDVRKCIITEETIRHGRAPAAADQGGRRPGRRRDQPSRPPRRRRQRLTSSGPGSPGPEGAGSQASPASNSTTSCSTSATAGASIASAQTSSIGPAPRHRASAVPCPAAWAAADLRWERGRHGNGTLVADGSRGPALDRRGGHVPPGAASHRVRAGGLLPGARRRLALAGGVDGGGRRGRAAGRVLNLFAYTGGATLAAAAARRGRDPRRRPARRGRLGTPQRGALGAGRGAAALDRRRCRRVRGARMATRARLRRRRPRPARLRPRPPWAHAGRSRRCCRPCWGPVWPSAARRGPRRCC